MKKYITTVVIVVGMLVGASVFATTSINLSPTTVNVKAGQTFSVPISVNPQGVKNYTVGVKLNYPSDLLQVNSFAFGGQWMALSQTGYDLTDNTNGVLIKTAGYPQGFSTNTQFGTVTFQAKKAGTGVIALANGTSALDQSNQNLFAGSSQVNVSVSTSTATPTPAVSVTPRRTAVPGQATVQPSPTPEVTELATPTPSIEPSVQQAGILGTIGDIAGLGTGNQFVALVVILAIVYGVYRVVRWKLKK